MKKPYISIIVPAYNEAAVLSSCLKSLQAQTIEHSYEIIVVDNASTDETAAIAADHGVKVVHEARKGVCAARQAGLRQAQGAIVVSSDADSIYPDGWLSRIERCFSMQPDVALLLGTYRFVDHKAFNMLLRAWERLAVRVQYAFGWQWYVSAANLAYRKELFKGYDVSLNSGGDELFVVKSLQPYGRVSFDLDNSIYTSDRRLTGRFIVALLNDFGLKYVMAYSLRSFKSARGVAVQDMRHAMRTSVWLTVLLSLLTILVITIAVAGLFKGISQLLSMIQWSSSAIASVTALVAGLASYVTFWPSSQLVIPMPWRVRTTQKIVALTFDDGPNDPYTQQIADIIESYGGKASFFQCGKLAQDDPKVPARLSRAGHTIGNHTYDHSFWKLWSYRKSLESVENTTNILTAATGKQIHFFRSPWLAKTLPLACALRSTGLLPIAGRFISLREVLQPDGIAMAHACLKKITPGSIIILHDSRETHRGDRTQTVHAVRTLCETLAADGYRFVSLDELFLPKQIGFEVRTNQ